jgi:DNA transformation protein
MAWRPTCWMTDSNSEIAGLLNLGPKSATWLNAAGIYTKSDLEETGAVRAFLKVKTAGYKPSLNLLYALEGALTGTRWDKLSGVVKSQLLLEFDAIEDFNKSCAINSSE